MQCCANSENAEAKTDLTESPNSDLSPKLPRQARNALQAALSYAEEGFPFFGHVRVFAAVAVPFVCQGVEVRDGRVQPFVQMSRARGLDKSILGSGSAEFLPSEAVFMNSPR